MQHDTTELDGVETSVDVGLRVAWLIDEWLWVAIFRKQLEKSART